MSQEQLHALLAALQDDADLKERFRVVPDLKSAVELANSAGFDVSEADWSQHQADQVIELSDDDLDQVAGGSNQCVTDIRRVSGVYRII